MPPIIIRSHDKNPSAGRFIATGTTKKFRLQASAVQSE